MTTQPLPYAQPQSQRRWPSWTWWCLPVLALVVVLVLVFARDERGPSISIRFADGRGLSAGDPLKHRGIEVGEVTRVALTDDLDGVVVDVVLHPEAVALARAETRFWIARPEIGLTGVRGAETVFGAHYLEVVPGGGRQQSSFIGDEDPQVRPTVIDGGLELVLSADDRSGVSAGAPVTYRRCVVGRVLSVGLASDATAVAVRIAIEPAYHALVRSDSRFWTTSGIEFDSGFLGIGAGLRMESLSEVIEGGIAFATPETGAPPAVPGQRFVLATKPEDDWLAWRPSLVVGSELLAGGVTLPAPERVAIRWTDSGWFGGEESLAAWGLVVSGPSGRWLLAPGAVLQAPEDAEVDARIAVAGVEFSAARAAGGRPALGLIPWDGVVGGVWPAARLRVPEAPEDLILVADPLQAVLPVDGGSLQAEGESGWRLPARLDSPDWLGALAVARTDGAVIGMVLPTDDLLFVKPLGPDMVAEMAAAQDSE